MLLPLCVFMTLITLINTPTLDTFQAVISELCGTWTQSFLAFPCWKDPAGSPSTNPVDDEQHQQIGDPEPSGIPRILAAAPLLCLYYLHNLREGKLFFNLRIQSTMVCMLEGGGHVCQEAEREREVARDYPAPRKHHTPTPVTYLFQRGPNIST